MTTDRAPALLERENPVRDDGLPGPRSADARALKERIMLAEPSQPRPRPPRHAVRIAAVGVAAAAVGFSALSVLPGDGPTSVERATAALNPSGDTILHTIVVGTRSDDPGTTTTTTTETWVRTSPPYDQRYVMTSGHAEREGATVDGRQQHYDAGTNTIYTLPTGPEIPLPRRSREKRFVEGDLFLLEDIRSLLASGEAREGGRVTVQGRDGVLIVFARSSTRLVVDADSYEPIEWTTVYDEGIRVTSRFKTYEQLPATKANLARLSLPAQHPGARISPTIVIEGVGARKA